ncbi:Rne/Rng family ribonuclease [Shimia sp. MMG029]|uniref:Rne/Rng family ribonuclease n=1 Tax=Shimia sp. MMG029 TaxID=3021978 RepID=UPI0022FDF23C|nr:ribonuclease E/G [Shimia sp. MMG029]MDA5555918.1 Rne/Rng family ribonuclease [Shimia sp. MMG029]
MAKKMLIDATHAEETRVVVVDGNKVEEFDFESENKRQLAGNIYLAKVTRVEPSLQAAFVDYGGNRHGFLAFSEIHPDYYQIPVADREALLEEERAYAEAMKARDEDEEKPKSRSRSRSRSRRKKGEDQVSGEAQTTETNEAVEAESPVDATAEAPMAEISGMETIDLVEDAGEDPEEGLSPMELVEDTPVEEPTEASDAGEDAPVETAPAEAAAANDAAEGAPADDAEATAEDSAEETAEAEEASESESTDQTEAGEAETDETGKDGGGKTMAANTEGEDAVVSKDPETGEETETEASTGDDAAEEAPAAEAEDAAVETVEADAVEVEAPEAEAAEAVTVEADAAEEVAGEATPAAESTEEAPAEEAAAESAEETAEADAPDAAAEEASDAETADEASEDSEAGGDESSEEDDDEESEDNGKKNGRRRSRRRGKRSDAAEKDENIESVADDDDSDDIRPPRKPRPRRYKIQEVIKVRQIMLVQVVKEERGNKGAALTTYLSLAGRYCVLMPNTARGGGISRKITNAADRKKLKEIASEIDVPQGAGLIVRTAGAKRTKSEIKRDYEYLQRLWEQIRELTLKSIAPAKIYEEGDLIKRSIRDLYSREIDEVLVEGERGYRIAKDFMKMIMPSHAKNVKQYHDALPLFARYQVESYLSGMFNPTVQLKSGGYIVIGVTEALVAIDVNSGRATKEGSIEETALKTNLEAAEEVARQLRLRDLAGLIVIDFIDMDERKNNTAVEKRLKDKLKTDRARIQVGRISGFGLLEMSRQRLRPGMIEATTQPCPHCHGTGLIRSDDNLALSILRQLEEEGTRGRSREVLVKAPVAIANYLMNQKREHIAQIEARYGLSVRVEGDPALVSPDFTIEKFKTATRVVPEPSAPVVSADMSIMDAIDEAEVEEVEEATAAAEETAPEDGEAKPKKRRRRRRRRRGGSDNADGDANGNDNASDENAEGSENADAETKTDEAPAEDAESEEKPKKRTRSRRSRSRGKKADAETNAEAEAPTEEAPAGDAAPEDAETVAEVEAAADPVVEADAAEAEAPEAEAVETAEAAPAPAEEAAEDATSVVEETAEPVVEEVAEAPAPEATSEPEPAVVEVAPEPAAPPKPKRRGWWSRG